MGTEDRRPKIEDRRPKIEDRRSKIEDRRPKIEDRRSKIEDRRSKTEDRRSKIEDRRSKTEDRRSNIEYRTSNIEYPTSKLPRAGRGAVLLEVIFALALFVMAGASVIGGLHACIQAAGNCRLEAQAADLAVSKLSEIQMGLTAAVDDGPTRYEEIALEEWTWQIVTEPVEISPDLPSALRVQIIITNDVRGYVYRLAHLMPQEAENPEQAVAGGSGGGSGL